MDAALAKTYLTALAGNLPRRGMIHLQPEGPRAVLSIDAPDARNAISVHMMLDLAVAVAQLEAGDFSTCLLRAERGPAFCAGGNLKDVKQRLVTPRHGRAMSVLMTDLLDRLLRAPVVSLAVIEGPAVGGGAELCTAVDHRLLGPSASIHFAQGALGVATGWGGARRLVQHIGRGPALRWLTTAARYDARACEAVGFGEVSADAPAEALRWLEVVEQLPLPAVRALKQQVASGSASEATEAFMSVWGGPDHRRALEGSSR